MKIRGIDFFAKSRSDEEKIDSLLLGNHIETCLLKLDELVSTLPQFNIANKEEVETSLKLAFVGLLFHDIGKISFDFQRNIINKIDEKILKEEERDKKMEEMEEFFGKTLMKIKIPHEVLSSIFLDFIEDVLEGRILSREDIRRVKTAILFHHYNDEFYGYGMHELEQKIVDIEGLEEYKDFVWEIYIDIISELKHILENIQNKLKNDSLRKLSQELLKALSDIAQKNAKSKKKEVSRFFEPNKGDLVFNLTLGFLMRIDYLSSFVGEEGRDIPPEIFLQLPISISSLKQKAIEKLKQKTGKKIIWQENLVKQLEGMTENLCLVAPTGSGKTEFVICFLGERKLLYTLPLRVALNDLYHRFCDYFEDKLVGLLHSSSFLEVMKTTNMLEVVEEKVAASRFLSYPFILSTPDQTMLVSLAFHGHERILTIFPYSTIVIDEIQAYNPEMLAIILNSLRIGKQFGANILVLTATLPNFVKELLETEINLKIIDVTSKEYEDLNVKNLKLRRHKLKVIEISVKGKEKENELLFKEIEKCIDQNREKRSILVTFNTVGKAIEFYKRIKNSNIKKERKIFLLHSRLLEKVKSERIKEIKELLEKGEEKLLIISTQVIEASVNLDCDCIITEISSIDSLIQRFGRVYRNRNEDYSGGPNCFVFVLIRTKDKKIIEKSHIYDLEVLEKTYNVLRKVAQSEGVLAYEDEKNIINEVYGEEKIKKKYKQKYEKFKDWVEFCNVRIKSEAQRLFRNIAGIQVCIFNEISDEVKKYLDGVEAPKNPDFKFKVQKEILDNSFQLPFFKFKKFYRFLSEIKKDTKRYKSVFFVELKEKEKLDELKEMGLEALQKEFLEDEEEWIESSIIN